MSPKRQLALLVLASLSAGCTVGPDYIRPETPMAERYLGQAATGSPACYALLVEGSKIVRTPSNGR